MGGQVAHITREVINIDRDYAGGDKAHPELRYDITLFEEGEKITIEQVLKFHEDIDKFIRNYRIKKEDE